MREQKLLCQLSNFYLRHLWSSLLALWAHKESGCLILPAHLFNNGCRAGITCCWYGGEMYQFSATTVLALMIGFYLLTFLMTLLIREKKENVDGYMVSNGSVGFGISAASMTATWIWAASFYAAASSGYTYGLSGPLHYGFWGALMILLDRKSTRLNSSHVRISYAVFCLKKKKKKKRIK